MDWGDDYKADESLVFGAIGYFLGFSAGGEAYGNQASNWASDVLSGKAVIAAAPNFDEWVGADRDKRGSEAKQPDRSGNEETQTQGDGDRAKHLTGVTTGEVIPGYAEELPADYEAQESGEQEHQSTLEEHQRLSAFLAEQKELMTQEYIARAYPVDKEPAAPVPGEVSHPIDPDPSPPARPRTRTPPSSSQPTLLDALQRAYGGAYDPETGGPSISEIASIYESPPPTPSDVTPPTSGAQLPPSAVARYAEPLMSGLDPEGLYSPTVDDVVSRVESYLPGRGTWERGVLKGAATFVVGTHPLGRLGLFAWSAYERFTSPKGMDPSSVADFVLENANPLYPLGRLGVKAWEAAKKNDDEAVAQAGTELLLSLIAMLITGRAGGAAGEGAIGEGEPILDGEVPAEGEGLDEVAGEDGLEDGADDIEDGDGSSERSRSAAGQGRSNKPDARFAELQPNKWFEPGDPMTVDEAIEHAKEGGDVFAKDKSTAYKIAEGAGDGPPVEHPPHGPGQKPHFHPRGPDGDSADAHVVW